MQSMAPYELKDIDTRIKGTFNAMSKFDDNLFLFQVGLIYRYQANGIKLCIKLTFKIKSNLVWIYSTKTKNLVNEAADTFKNFFPNKNLISKIVGAHYSATNKKFYFFSGKKNYCFI